MGEKIIEKAKALAAAGEIDEQTANRRKSLIKFGSVTVFTAIVLIFLTIAWFSVNKETEAEGMTIKTATLPFDIATKGANIRNEDKISAKGPGGNGELSLYVIPKTNDAMTVRVNLNVVAFSEVDKKDGLGNPVYKAGSSEEVDTELIEITNAAEFASKARASGVNNAAAADAAADYVAAANYLKGHILFFGGTGDTSSGTAAASRYYYTDPYTERSFTQAVAANNEGKAVKVPIYWMWTNTLGQVALNNNVSGKRNGYPILADNDTDKSKITQYLKTNQSDIFVSGASNSAIDAVTAAYATSADFNTNGADAFTALSEGYNLADFAIGTKISYFMIEVSVEAAS